MSKHNPQPWRYSRQVGPSVEGEIYSANGRLVAILIAPQIAKHAELDEDAQRIVACVNACEGIDDLSIIEKFKQQLAEDSGDPCFAPHWPAGIKVLERYRLLCDDKGHSGGTWLQVLVAEDGDVYVSMHDWEDSSRGRPSENPSVRVRTRRGGGRNPRVRQALLNLAEAIHLDNLDNGRKPE